ncbi:MAG: hypothetical protein IJF19_02065 [Clostridia bacterium]|nr:hypothetical protein [Clostridia bacterium]
MKESIVRSFVLDGDICEVVFRFDEASEMYLGDYPDFESQSRYTPRGYRWVNATQDSCKKAKHKYYSEKDCLDCGSCRFFTTEKEGDLIGICSESG